MDSREHIATLCALGTVGVAATGFAFGSEPCEASPPRPGKRKWPGSSTTTPFSTRSDGAIYNRRSMSHVLSGSKTAVSASTLEHSTSSARDGRQPSLHNGNTPSRGSSATRRSILRHLGGNDKDSLEERDPISRPNWLKRLSSLSSSRASSPATSLQSVEPDHNHSPQWISSRPATSDLSLPNKLVKRSFSHRALSQDQAQGTILRRPATSHQRSQTFRNIIIHQSERPTTSNPASRPDSLVANSDSNKFWRPYFESRYPRKRRRSEVTVESNLIRTVVPGTSREPKLILGTALDKASIANDELAISDARDAQGQVKSNTDVRRLHRSLSSLRRPGRRRNFTDPIVQLSRTDATGTISYVGKDSPISPFTGFPTQAEQHSANGSPALKSSPPFSSYEYFASYRKRHSVAPSDPLTASSDNDMRIFTDDDSVDFRSDSAYDSVATRATASSHSALHSSKLETIFAERTSTETEPRTLVWNSVSHTVNGEQNDHDMPDQPSETPADLARQDTNVTISRQESPDTVQDTVSLSTPVRPRSIRTEDVNQTPVPVRRAVDNGDSSPALLPSTMPARDYENIDDMINDMTIHDADLDRDLDDIDWSPKLDSARSKILQWPSIETESITHEEGPLFLVELQHNPDNASSTGAQKPSIFDWSEHHQSYTRPKTVHGKHGVDQRSRSTGRKGPTQLHFRSQSVPVNREQLADELQVPATTTKYSTWKLGTKPVSEEWSDDFEFDDVPNVHESLDALVFSDVDAATSKQSIKSVKIPQSIIDRQPSVHLQFGQVQEFMLLVEELKRLRVRAADLQILHGTSRQLWEDAESIINLATINDEELPSILPSSPASSDLFPDESTSTSRHALAPSPFADQSRPKNNRRSISNVGTPPLTGRARGESLVQAKNFLQTIHQTRNRLDSSPLEVDHAQTKKLPFDTQDLKDLVVRSGVITRALKEELRRAEGVAVSPYKTPPRPKDPPFSQMFRPPEPYETSPCPPFKKPGLPKSRSANGYLEEGLDRHFPVVLSSPLPFTAVLSDS